MPWWLGSEVKPARVGAIAGCRAPARWISTAGDSVGRQIDERFGIDVRKHQVHRAPRDRVRVIPLLGVGLGRDPLEHREGRRVVVDAVQSVPMAGPRIEHFVEFGFPRQLVADRLPHAVGIRLGRLDPVGVDLVVVQSGLLDEQEALHHDERHIVSNVVGAVDMRIEIGPEVELARRDTLLLATDGLLDNLTPEEIVEMVRKGPLGPAARRLAAVARARMERPEGGRPSKPDDLTFVLFRRR